MIAVDGAFVKLNVLYVWYGSPENVTSMRVTAAEIGREPYYCKHDQGYLYRKDPNAPEKYCAQCGMVYAAEKHGARDPNTRCRGCGKLAKYCTCEKQASREDDEDDGPGSYSEQKDERDWHWRDKKPEPKEKK